MNASNYLWVILQPEQSNCDQLPEWLAPRDGCPECGSVWTGVTAVAGSSTCLYGRFDGARWVVQQIGGIAPVCAVRLRCVQDHLVEYDGFLLTVIPPPQMGLMAATAVLGVLGAFAFLHGFRAEATP